MSLKKVSEITNQDLIDYIIIDDADEKDKNTLDGYLEIAKNFIKSYTGIDDLDKHPDFVIVVLVLCQDMWDNRTLYPDKDNLNKVVQIILGMYSENLLPKPKEVENE